MDTTIAVFPSQSVDRRLRVSLRSGEGVGGLQLIDESFSEHVGWFAQSSVNLAPEQVAALRLLLGAQGTCEPNRTRSQLAAAGGKPMLSVVRAS